MHVIVCKCCNFIQFFIQLHPTLNEIWSQGSNGQLTNIGSENHLYSVCLCLPFSFPFSLSLHMCIHINLNVCKHNIPPLYLQIAQHQTTQSHQQAHCWPQNYENYFAIGDFKSHFVTKWRHWKWPPSFNEVSLHFRLNMFWYITMKLRVKTK